MPLSLSHARNSAWVRVWSLPGVLLPSRQRRWSIVFRVLYQQTNKQQTNKQTNKQANNCPTNNKQNKQTLCSLYLSLSPPPSYVYLYVCMCVSMCNFALDKFALLAGCSYFLSINLLSVSTATYMIRRGGMSFSGWGCVLYGAGVSPEMRASPSTCRVSTIDWQVLGLCRCLCLTHVTVSESVCDRSQGFYFPPDKGGGL